VDKKKDHKACFHRLVSGDATNKKQKRFSTTNIETDVWNEHLSSSIYMVFDARKLKIEKSQEREPHLFFPER